MDVRALVPQGGRDLRHDSPRVRDCESAKDSDVSRRRSSRRAAHSGRWLHGSHVAAMAQQMTVERRSGRVALRATLSGGTLDLSKESVIAACNRSTVPPYE